MAELRERTIMFWFLVIIVCLALLIVLVVFLDRRPARGRKRESLKTIRGRVSSHLYYVYPKFSRESSGWYRVRLQADEYPFRGENVYFMLVGWGQVKFVFNLMFEGGLSPEQLTNIKGAKVRFRLSADDKKLAHQAREQAAILSIDIHQLWIKILPKNS